MPSYAPFSEDERKVALLAFGPPRYRFVINPAGGLPGSSFSDFALLPHFTRLEIEEAVHERPKTGCKEILVFGVRRDHLHHDYYVAAQTPGPGGRTTMWPYTDEMMAPLSDKIMEKAQKNVWEPWSFWGALKAGSKDLPYIAFFLAMTILLVWIYIEGARHFILYAYMLAFGTMVVYGFWKIFGKTLFDHSRTRQEGRAAISRVISRRAVTA